MEYTTNYIFNRCFDENTNTLRIKEYDAVITEPEIGDSEVYNSNYIFNRSYDEDSNTLKCKK